jgi:hypothetical protein
MRYCKTFYAFQWGFVGHDIHPRPFSVGTSMGDNSPWLYDIKITSIYSSNDIKITLIYSSNFFITWISCYYVRIMIMSLISF